MTDREEQESAEAKALLGEAKRREIQDEKYPVKVDPDRTAKDANKKRRRDAKAERAEDDNKLRKLMVYWALRFVGLQIVVCDLVMAGYVITELCKNHPIAPQVIMTWLSTSLVEVVGILWVIARNLFPFHDKYRDKKAEQRKNTKGE
ncbi:hypothetical protein PG2006B_1128 [Bifidobacterium animalis subsp. animalis]|uniref:hypothetical protein n=1 Tax=Bifidobacterium animalis TaxID=28025 RepID=UPI0010209FB9|nr:hypothetical protein [Bifidobacterium animalis]RYN12662.1 hypothetical protein PG2006B_1128 [Bifidobacterium animalis subsp. animalis]